MRIPLEDNFTDVIGKAQRGLGISDSQLAQECGVAVERIRRVRGGEVDADTLRAIAPVLRLNADALIELARQRWYPAVEPLDGLAQFNTPFGDITVNAYLVWEPQTKRAIAFDTGADCREMLRRIGQDRLRVECILLTHAHDDHIAALDELRSATGARVYASRREPVPAAELIDESMRFYVGELEIETRLTWGHSPGGLTYFITGLERPIAVVGDSLFAGSMGGGNVSYEAAVRNNREKILTVPDETIICPGHGPLTTVANEKQHNPFFA